MLHVPVPPGPFAVPPGGPARKAGSPARTRRAAGTWLLVCPLPSPEQTLLVLVGHLVDETVGQLCDQVAEALGTRPPRLQLDLCGLDACDVHGVEALRAVVGNAAAAGVDVTFLGMAWALSLPPAAPAPGRDEAQPAADPR